jgi:putative transposase
LERIRTIHAEGDGAIGMPRMHEQLAFEGRHASRNRVARLVASAGLYGAPQRRRWQRKRIGARPNCVRDQLKRDFVANEPNTKWVTDITYIRTAEGWLYLCVVLDLYSKKVVGWAMDTLQDRHLVLRAVLMALWQRGARSEPVILHSGHGTQFTCEEYQQFLAGHNLVCSMSAVSHCGDNAAAEGFLGILKRERVNRRHYRRIAEARSDVFDYIERFHNPRMQQRLDAEDQKFLALTQLSAEKG